MQLINIKCVLTNSGILLKLVLKWMGFDPQWVKTISFFKSLNIKTIVFVSCVLLPGEGSIQGL